MAIPKKPAPKKSASKVKNPSLRKKTASKKAAVKGNSIRLKLNGKDITILGTAHVLAESKKEVELLIAKLDPDTVCVELCDSRYQSLKNKERWRKLDIVKVIKEGNGFLLFANMILAAFQKRIGVDLESAPGDEMVTAFRLAEEKKRNVVLADRDVNVTLKRAWRLSSFKDKMNILELLTETMFEKDKIEKEEIDNLMKGQDMFNEVMALFAEKLPKVKQVFIDERDQFIANKIATAPGKKILAVVGKGHLKGIERFIRNRNIYHPEIEKAPKPGIIGKIFPWLFFAVIVVMIVAGILTGKAPEMLFATFLSSGTATALFTALSLAHPLTVLAAFVAGPVGLLLPTTSAGMLLAPLETFLRKPTVHDFEKLNVDMLTFSGFFRNRVLKVLVLFVGSTVGAIIGNTILFVWIARLLAK